MQAPKSILWFFIAIMVVLVVIVIMLLTKKEELKAAKSADGTQSLKTSYFNFKKEE